MRPLGTGLVYSAELDELFREDNPALAVLELEPQTLWDRTFPASAKGAPVYVPNAVAMQQIASLPQHKLIHSVSFPIGGSARVSEEYVEPLASVVTQMSAAWVSEHLSFNAIEAEQGIASVGFLLPPRQTRAGVALAVANIERMRQQMPVPFAFETGVNYLQPRSDELSEGEFFAAIAEQADCGILLDLHNLWANERNGRQRVEDCLAAMPLERVWEVHLAGGMMLGDCYLDSHSDVISPELFDIAMRVMPRLPNVGAVLFEVLPSFIATVGIGAVREQLSRLQDLWALRSPNIVSVAAHFTRSMQAAEERSDVKEWEQVLGALAVGRGTSEHSALAEDLRRDRGIEVLRTLVGEFRSGLITRAMHFTMTLLLVHVGANAVRALLQEYERSCYPEVFTSSEANQFAMFMRERLASLPHVPNLEAVLNFEHALIRASLYGARTRLDWEFDPVDLFEALDSGRAPVALKPVHFSMDIVPQD